jgi:HSP20 family protein
MAAPGLKNKTSKWKSRITCFLFLSEKEEQKEESSKVDNYYKKEFNYQAFRRSFSLPDYADENKITADYKDGILHVAIDKKRGTTKNS